MKKRKKKILVVMGGSSSEYEISLKTGKNVFAALDTSRYQRFSAVLPRKEPIPVLISNIQKVKPDVIFLAMHGEFGEDGTIQRFLDALRIPYTGSGMLASALAMDKEKSSEIFRHHGLIVPDYLCLETPFSTWKRGFQVFPIVVKPVTCGSSVGISLVKKQHELKKAVRHAFQYGNRIMIQRYTKGREVTCGILEDPKTHKPFALPPTEIIPETSDFFDYRAKYMPHASREITPAKLPQSMIARIQKAALAAHHALGCRGISRTDMIVSKNRIFVLETNTLPGMTETSLFPQAARAAGIRFSRLVDMIIESALQKNT